MFSELTDGQVKSFNQDGYLIVRGFFSEKETEKLHQVALRDEAISKHSFDLNDQSGKKTKLALWYVPGDDIFGLLTRSERMVDAVDKLLDGDSAVCHFHSKLMQKEPKVGGAWEWHQDYGYWYKNEFLFPDQLISVMVAVTEATKANGCLQVIKGSHKLGRVEHGFAGEQVGASARFVELALQTLELVYVELKPGDTLFFHSNILHRSEANLSDRSRWSLISAYNREANVGYKNNWEGGNVPIDVVKDETLLQAQAVGFATDADYFLNREQDHALKEE